MKMRGFVFSLVLSFVLAVAFSTSAMANDGEAIFGKKCKACHSTGSKKILGPGLEGTGKQHTKEWLKKWIVDPQGTWEANDAETQEMKKRVGGESRDKTKMKLKGMDKENVDALVDWLMTL